MLLAFPLCVLPGPIILESKGMQAIFQKNDKKEYKKC